MATKRREKSQTTAGRHVIDIEEAQEERRRKRQQAAASKRRKKRQEEKDRQEEIRATTTPEARSKKRRKKVTTKRILIFVIVVAILAFFAGTAVQVVKLHMERNDVEKERDAKKAEKNRLEKELTRINDPEYIEEQARDRLRMIRQGEILYVFPEEEEDNSE